MMDSDSAASSAAAAAAGSSESRPQAGPLPRKRGEIGFREGMELELSLSNASVTVLPERHPADRPLPDDASDSNTQQQQNQSQPSTQTQNNSSNNTGNAVSAASNITRAASPSPSSASESSSPSLRKPGKHSWLRALQEKRYAGITIITLIRLPLQFIILSGTIVAWVFIAKQISRDAADSDSDSSSSDGSIGGSASIFVHVTFAITVLAQLIFLERGIFFLRAQRYAYLNPRSGRTRSNSDRHLQFGGGAGMMAFAPWNRPPLPTYAATLAQSGVGTGDVEDNVIAIPPPPAYGHTRGSRLLLQGYLRESLRLALRDSGDGGIRREDVLSLAELGENRRSVNRLGVDGGEGDEGRRRDRPVSYRSTDSTWEERCDAERAMRLAETLETLENTANTSSTRR